MQGQSIVPAPINTLPVEILALIFKMAMPRCARNNKQQIEFYDPAAVCAYWRRVATNALNLWTHIDAGPNTPSALTELLLKRTKSSLIHLHVYEPGEEQYELTPLEQIGRTVDMLEPHMHRVSTLDINSDGFSTSLVAHVLNNWLTYGSMNISESLSISCSYADHPPLDDTENMGAAQKENAVGMLRALSTLRLYRVVFDWNSSAYHGLADLRLDCVQLDEDIFISTSEFAKILSTNPALAVLKLADLEVRRTADWNQPAPTLMNRLSTLNLVDMAPFCLELILPLISLSSSLSGISLGISVHGRPQNELESFLLRSKITTLYCRGRTCLYSSDSSHLPLQHLLADLRYLVIHKVNIVRNTASMELDTLHPPKTSLPHPLNVTLLHCRLTLEGLSDLVLRYGIGRLHLDQCRTYRLGNLYEIQNELLRAHPQLQCHVSEVDPTFQLACRTMFDW